MMARKKRKVFRIAGWTLLGFLSLIILVTVTFFAGRNWILKKVVEELNRRQPGKVQITQINLIPLMDFPDAVLQLRDLQYFEAGPDSLRPFTEPLLMLDEVYVSLDIVQLMRKSIEVSQVHLKNGYVRIEVGADSMTNIERALGIRFGHTDEVENDTSGLSMGIDLEGIELSDIHASYVNQVTGDSALVNVVRVRSRFRYTENLIESGIKLKVDIEKFKYQKINVLNKNDIELDGDIVIEPTTKIVRVSPSSLDIAGLELETAGVYTYGEQTHIDLNFTAVNTGLEALNFLLLGILDLDEIRQTGSGSMELSGSVKGPLGGEMPVISVNGNVKEIGFMIKSLRKEVTGIGFGIAATNGKEQDLSGACIELRDFQARFPDGMLRGNLLACNLEKPEFDIGLQGMVDLAGLDRILKNKVISDLKGTLNIQADVEGSLNRKTEVFSEDRARLNIVADNVGFIMGSDTVSQVNGQVFLNRNLAGIRGMSVDFNGNRAKLELETENLFHYLLGYDRDVSGSVGLESASLNPSTLLRDTSLSHLLGEELKGLAFRAGVTVKKHELDRFLEQDSIPRVDLSLERFEIELPYYSNISNLEADLKFGPDSILFSKLKGKVGESMFEFTGGIHNHMALVHSDTGAELLLRFDLNSDLMRAEDFFSYKDGFLLPEAYRTEYLEDFRLAGSLRLPVRSLVVDSADLDFGLELDDMDWGFRYYPLDFRDFNAHISKAGRELHLNRFSGKVGESNVKMDALLGNYADTVRENMYGYVNLESDLLDFNELMNYRIPEEARSASKDTGAGKQAPKLDQVDYPNFDFRVDIGELRYGEYRLFGMKGGVRSTTEKIFYLDSLEILSESGGWIMVDGQFNVANPWYYNFSANVEMEEVNVKDLNFEMQDGEETYTLEDNFTGLITASGMAEVFLTPKLELDISTTTAVFNVEISDGSLINFTPLYTLGDYLDNRNLSNVRFSTLRNRITLMDSRIYIPLMHVESTIGQILIEGEQGLDNTQLYLLRIPRWLIKDAVISRLFNIEDDDQQDEIYRMKTGRFMLMTTWSDGEETEVKIGDKRDRYR